VPLGLLATSGVRNIARIGSFARGVNEWVRLDKVSQHYKSFRKVCLTQNGGAGNLKETPELSALFAKSHAAFFADLDPGWWLIKTLELFGLARDVVEPAEVGEREGLRRVGL
jgi:hypothetical protein